jgi:hypothetical protein
MKHILPLNYVITSLALLLLLTACKPDVKPTVTYEENIKKNLRLSHVFVPPSDAYPPYTLLHYIKGEGFQQVCEASEVTGIAEENLSRELVSKNLSNSAMSKAYNLNYGVALAQKGVGYAGVDYQDIKNVVITLEKGKIISMPSVHISDVNRTISTGKCAEDIKFFTSTQPNSKFFIPREVYQYSMKYSILDKDGVNITAKLSKNLQKVVLANAGIDVDNEEIMTMDGDELYIGFKGAAMSNGMIPKGIREKSFIDVTQLVKSIQ